MLPSHLSMLMSLLSELNACHIGMCSLSILKKVPWSHHFNVWNEHILTKVCKLTNNVLWVYSLYVRAIVWRLREDFVSGLDECFYCFACLPFFFFYNPSFSAIFCWFAYLRVFDLKKDLCSLFFGWLEVVFDKLAVVFQMLMEPQDQTGPFDCSFRW